MNLLTIDNIADTMLYEDEFKRVQEAQESIRKRWKLAHPMSRKISEKRNALALKKLRKILILNVIINFMAGKNQTSRSHHSTSKSVSCLKSSSSNDGGDPDPDSKHNIPHHSPSLIILVTLTLAIYISAHISNIEVVQ
ncbi:hypothetical protein [Candidatus Symbiopectobacterium sp. NZEC135]|uniref:hypothetical protein n=1 Tax=Candidatus Symbiopectobacterium sp. NZEC135 TaxID=2820471 RepID=UPI002226DE67|nr:hypothetical protein [Candidatus Symbiopectobacterium sp. NZEC135]MCW2481176.1 hypothetical protein [Candidatus Symbiopectobacterium sp. NZEC135]